MYIIYDIYMTDCCHSTCVTFVISLNKATPCFSLYGYHQGDIDWWTAGISQAYTFFIILYIIQP